jgi:hypothetical protein
MKRGIQFQDFKHVRFPADLKVITTGCMNRECMYVCHCNIWSVQCPHSAYALNSTLSVKLRMQARCRKYGNFLRLEIDAPLSAESRPEPPTFLFLRKGQEGLFYCLCVWHFYVRFQPPTCPLYPITFLELPG